MVKRKMKMRRSVRLEPQAGGAFWSVDVSSPSAPAPSPDVQVVALSGLADRVRVARDFVTAADEALVATARHRTAMVEDLAAAEAAFEKEVREFRRAHGYRGDGLWPPVG